MAIIYLIRHAQASFNADDYDQLSKQGYEQAQLLGQYLAEKRFNQTTVVSGNMQRHQQTLVSCLQQINQAQHSINLTSLPADPAWNEYDHSNILATYDQRFTTVQSTKAYLSSLAAPRQQFKASFNQAMERWIQASEDSAYNESFTTFSQRIQLAWQQLVTQPSDQTTLVFTSGGPISWICCHLLNIPVTKFMQFNWHLVNCGISKIVISKDRKHGFLSSLNEHHVFEKHHNQHLITYT